MNKSESEKNIRPTMRKGGKLKFVGWRWNATAVTVLLLAVCMISSSVMSEEKKTVSLENTRDILEKWVETSRIISKEKRDLVLSSEMLHEQIELLQREIKTLKDKTAETQKSIAEADKKREDMVAENEKLKKASASLVGIAGTLEKRTKTFLKRVPDPIRERVKPLSQRIPENTEQTKLTVAERFQNVVGILNEINKFNREVTVTSEVRPVEDGTSIEVMTMYVGIGQGYYVNASGTVAGVGYADENGWNWKANNNAAAHIASAIAIFKNEKVTSFVQLPVEIK